MTDWPNFLPEKLVRNVHHNDDLRQVVAKELKLDVTLNRKAPTQQ